LAAAVRGLEGDRVRGDRHGRGGRLELGELGDTAELTDDLSDLRVALGHDVEQTGGVDVERRQAILRHLGRRVGVGLGIGQRAALERVDGGLHACFVAADQVIPHHGVDAVVAGGLEVRLAAVVDLVLRAGVALLGALERRARLVGVGGGDDDGALGVAAAHAGYECAGALAEPGLNVLGVGEALVLLAPRLVDQSVDLGVEIAPAQDLLARCGDVVAEPAVGPDDRRGVEDGAARRGLGRVGVAGGGALTRAATGESAEADEEQEGEKDATDHVIVFVRWACILSRATPNLRPTGPGTGGPNLLGRVLR
jgi:hypothetical protein